jgi:hypothetical protein
MGRLHLQYSFFYGELKSQSNRRRVIMPVSHCNIHLPFYLSFCVPLFSLQMTSIKAAMDWQGKPVSMMIAGEYIFQEE